MKPKKEIKDFIGVFDNYIRPEQCDDMVKLFKNKKSLGQTFDRLQTEGSPVSVKKDIALSINERNIHEWVGPYKDFFVNIDRAIKEYDQETGISKALESRLLYTSFKIQQTLPGEGYHIWHIEQSSMDDQIMRALVFSVYLNDVEEGGETEFLHQKQRVKPVKGRIVIWPASFPFLHRGNPPLSGEKYLLTSWLRTGFLGFKGFDE